MNEILTLLCLGVPITLFIFLFTGYKLLGLPIVSNLVYLHYGGAIAGVLISDVADAVAKVKQADNKDTVDQIVTILTQYNILPATTEHVELIESETTDE